MGYIVIDTCVWIELASKPSLRPLLDALKEYVQPPSHKLVVPSPIATEFARHRDECRGSWEKSLKGHIGGLKFIYQAIPNTRADLVRARDLANETIQKSRETIEDSVDVVGGLLDGAEPWQPKADDFEDACNRCLEMRAPAVRKNRSSVGDALIWRAVLDLLRSKCVWLCTENTSDFSNPQRLDELHSDLAAEASGGPHALQYYSDPSVLIEELRKLANAPTADLPRYYDYVAPVPTRCPRCDSEGSFADGAYLRSQFGGLTWQFICGSCGYRFDTGDFWD